MNLWKRFLCLSAFTFMIASCDQSSMFGGGTEGEGLTGTLVDQQGIPAANVVVTLYAANYLPGNTSGDYSNIKLTTRTDTNGRFSFSNISSGQYNILGKAALPVLPRTGVNSGPSGSSASNDSLFCFHDSISISNLTRLAPDTLRPPGSLTGRILMQPDDDSRTMTIQVPGTDYRSDVDSTGTFTLTHLGQGKYRLRAITPLNSYSQLFKEINCRSGRNDTLPRPLFPPCSAPRNHFSLDSSTVALWTFSSHNNGTFKDWSANGFSLSNANNFALTASPYDSAVVFTGSSSYLLSRAGTPALTIGSTGKITFEARIYLSHYPSAGTLNASSEIMGFYENRILIDSAGTLIASLQKLNGTGTGYWYSPGSSAGAVPLNRWVDVAVAIDQSANQVYGYIDGHPIQFFGTTNTDLFRISTSLFTVGDDAQDNLPLDGKIDEIRVSNNLVLGVGLPLRQNDPIPLNSVDSISHFGINGSTVALWTFNAYRGSNQIPDIGPHGFPLTPTGTLPLEASTYGSAVAFTGSGQYLSTANSPLLTVGGTGKVTYETRIYLSRYPSAGTLNASSEIMGFYENRILIDSAGTLIASLQKLNSTGTGYWYSPGSAARAVPLNRWVDVAVAIDQSANQVYGYIDGHPIQFFGVTNTDLFRVSTSLFTVGDDAQDNLPFDGKIDEIRVSNNLVLGAGLPLIAGAPP